MPRKTKAVDATEQLAAFDERVKLAEVQYVKATSKTVDMSLESCEILVELVEMGEGREPDVLREALAVGLRAKKRIRTQTEEYDEENEIEQSNGNTALPPPALNGGPPPREGTPPAVTLGALALSVVGAPNAFARPGEEVLPPSKTRPRMETDGAEE